MRSLPQKVRNPRTQGQRSQRGKFALVLSLLKPLTAFLRIGWKLYANKQSAFNAATSHTLANAIAGTYPDYRIELNKVLVTRGSLTGVSNPLTNVNDNVITMQWENNSGVGSAKATDKALAVVFNSTTGDAISITDGANRSVGQQTVTVPEIWAGCDVHCYLGFISEDGKEVSNSFYYGKQTITVS